MWLRPVSLVVALSLVSSCSMPRAGVAASAVTAIAGAVLLYDGSNVEPSYRTFDPTPVLVGEGEKLLGASLLVGAAALMVASLAGFSQEHAEAPPPPAAPPMPRAIAAPRVARPGSARAALDGRIAQVAFELRLEARAGHCAAASALALRLERLDRALLLALIMEDGAIAACVEVEATPPSSVLPIPTTGAPDVPPDAALRWTR